MGLWEWSWVRRYLRESSFLSLFDTVGKCTGFHMRLTDLGAVEQDFEARSTCDLQRDGLTRPEQVYRVGG